uniref:FAS1 domain-containing protein n=1 Tax=Physcomitrium patens TaxID=3218 RepID=A0A2K1KB96_PHYPA|nr:hypothetical protein PHYPA_010232 [Physcomitrium patens]
MTRHPSPFSLFVYAFIFYLQCTAFDLKIVLTDAQKVVTTAFSFLPHINSLFSLQKALNEATTVNGAGFSVFTP